MEITQSFKSTDGQLHSDIRRCAAADLHHQLHRTASPTQKEFVLSFSHCLQVIEQRRLIERIFKQMDALTKADSQSKATTQEESIVL